MDPWSAARCTRRSAATWNAKANSGANTDITSVALNQTGLKVKGGDSNKLVFKPNETMTAERTPLLVDTSSRGWVGVPNGVRARSSAVRVPDPASRCTSRVPASSSASTDLRRWAHG